jgi:hypothetical protein
MKFLFEIFLQLILVLFVVTQLIVPMFADFDYFWIFKKSKVKESTTTDKFSVHELNDLEAQVIEKTESYKEAVSQIETTEEKIKSIKEKSKVN